MNRVLAGIPEVVHCATCGRVLSEPFGWCSQCRAAYCLECGRQHFCHETCQANGCHAGLCVRLVRNGELAATWGLPGPD